MREEIGVLPMPWSLARAPETRAQEPGALRAGYRGGFFHPATGYSLPAAVRVAEAIGQSLLEAEAGAPLLGASWERFVRTHRLQSGYALRLNRLLFTGFAETDMWGVLSRFYGLSEALIERFYAQSSSLSDRTRILIGWPPRGFSLRRALAARSLPEQVGAA
jgi:lycopene beta-cyclase